MLKKLVMALVALIPVGAHATPVIWTLDDMRVGVAANPQPNSIYQVGFLSGSFVFDADTGLYSDIDISSTATIGYRCDPTFTTGCLIRPTTETFDAKHYDSASTASVYVAPTGLAAYDNTKLNGILDGDTVLLMRFAQALTNAGGSVAVTGGWEYYCANTACYYPTDDLFRTVIPASGPMSSPTYSPRIVGVAVPEPGTLALFLIGGLSLVVMRRKRANLSA